MQKPYRSTVAHVALTVLSEYKAAKAVLIASPEALQKCNHKVWAGVYEKPGCQMAVARSREPKLKDIVISDMV